MLIVGTGVLARIGYYRIITFSFGLKIVMGTMLYLLGPRMAALIVYYIVDWYVIRHSENLFCSVTCHFIHSLFCVAPCTGLGVPLHYWKQVCIFWNVAVQSKQTKQLAS